MKLATATATALTVALALSVSVRASVLDYSQAAASDANIVVQYSFDGADTAERQEDKTSGTNDLVIVTQGTGDGANIAYSSGYDGTSDAVTPERVDNGNGAAFRTGSAVNTTTATAFSFEAIVRFQNLTDGDAYMFATRSSTTTRDYWTYQDDQSVADDVVAISGDSFGNVTQIAPNIESGDWYFIAVTKELVAGDTRVNTWMANLSNGDTTLTQIATNEIESGSFQNNIEMGVGILNNIGTFQQAFNGSIDELSLYTGLRSQSAFQSSLDLVHFVPEPASMTLLGGVGLALCGRRNRRS